MNIVIINGQNHKGNTYLVARELADKVGGEIKEFFLPKDFSNPCTGCSTCFKTDLTHCPHYDHLRPITEAIDWAELIILASPVYVFHATGQMMSLLDHPAYARPAFPDKISEFSQNIRPKNAISAGTICVNSQKAASPDLHFPIPRILSLLINLKILRPEPSRAP